eukprot:TRINITY_DN77373_c0_g1_i1.p1 TRINITY_DN77373_c0_g1~~TRINITY_DN77373_c0_g1_i1.p1  ORF type:complete len:296 (-),score=28.72 TRINITY_DN77373_c0_g1_i1:29-916(-)
MVGAESARRSRSRGTRSGGEGVAEQASTVETCPVRRRITSKQPSQVFSDSSERLHWPLETVVINLDRRADRWNEVNGRLAPLVSNDCLRVRRFRATDGSCDDSDVPETVVAREWNTDRNAKYDGRAGSRAGVRLQMSSGERACAMSHVRVWREVANSCSCISPEQPTVILEDDAVFAKRFHQRIRVALNAATRVGADIVYLGYIKGAPWRRHLGHGLYEAEYLWTTVGYVLWPRGARKLLTALPVDQPVDNFMGWLMASGSIRGLAIAPALVDQKDEWDCGSDVFHSDDAVLESV